MTTRIKQTEYFKHIHKLLISSVFLCNLNEKEQPVYISEFCLFNITLKYLSNKTVKQYRQSLCYSFINNIICKFDNCKGPDLF